MTKDDFERQLDHDPSDWQTRLIYADWLEEEGNTFCETQRWMVERKIQPGRDARGRWRWWGHYLTGKPSFPGDVPKNVFQQMPFSFGSFSNLNTVWTRLEAEQALHNALIESREISQI